ncbi:hypothetical protein OBBRIDRAFT_799186 [Obba rivulosa]|uniref:Uncharacterized protein n=1 Tax=Obba rivulosa TaxID=1052685 RepID=A0A8E2AH13_9APHY|nr:hypothetical protein OBBRIDRAFT_799186 [Obba rivulosa]
MRGPRSQLAQKELRSVHAGLRISRKGVSIRGAKAEHHELCHISDPFHVLHLHEVEMAVERKGERDKWTPGD